MFLKHFNDDRRNRNRNRAARLPDQKRQEAQKMTEQAKEARRAYKREWNRKNRDKVAESQRRYWERKAAAEAAQDQQTDEPARQEA